MELINCATQYLNKTFQCHPSARTINIHRNSVLIHYNKIFSRSSIKTEYNLNRHQKNMHQPSGVRIIPLVMLVVIQFEVIWRNWFAIICSNTFDIAGSIVTPLKQSMTESPNLWISLSLSFKSSRGKAVVPNLDHSQLLIQRHKKMPSLF